MPSALLTSTKAFLRLSWSYDGDYYVSVEVESDGYAGHVGAHVTEPEFDEFSRQLLDLETSRKGTATLSSIVQGEFEIAIKSLDNLGHIGAIGKLRNCVDRTGLGHVNELSFGFDVDPSDFVSFVKNFDAN